MYVCGPTVYGLPHLGHGRHALVYDVLRRYLEWCGLRVRMVSNITDIDDKIIARAHEEGRTTDQIVDTYEKEWWRAMDGLDVRVPDDVPHATDYVERMVEFITALMAEGKAYETSDGVYFVSSSVSDYGLLAHQSLSDLRAGARVESIEEKREPTDFVLWKKAKPGEPSWPSPWGDGRPGWHTECVVMSLGLLGDGFDLHAAGEDLKFPHHENERAQAVASGHIFARHWMHHGFVTDPGGEKMSKSLGNFTTLTDLLDQLKGDGRPFRLLVLQSHYRTPMTVSPRTIADARSAVARLDDFARRFPVTAVDRVSADEAVVARFRAAMDDDLNTPVALAILFEQVRMANSAVAADPADPALGDRAAATVYCLADAVGLAMGAVPDEVPEEIAALVAERDQARAVKDWSRSDRLRDELIALGWTVSDGATQTGVHRT
jgi:cysteinyl-tRNA synthetase